MQCYSYKGPVFGSFNKLICPSWVSTTYAPTKNKAMANLCYHYKKEHGLVIKSKIYLPSQILEL